MADTKTVTAASQATWSGWMPMHRSLSELASEALAVNSCKMPREYPW